MFKDFNIAQIGHPILRNKTKGIPISEIKSLTMYIILYIFG